MGHSMGGGICSLFASTFPECVDRLVMLDFVAFGEEFISSAVANHIGEIFVDLYLIERDITKFVTLEIA